MLASTAHIPGIHATSFTVPGGNGLGDLEVLATDPLAWVQSEISRRRDPVATESVGFVDSPLTTDPNSVMGRDLTQPIKDKLAEIGKGLVVSGALLLLGVLLVVLGAYQFTKE